MATHSNIHSKPLFPGEGNGSSFQYLCLENPKHRGAWWATAHRVTRSRTWHSTHVRSTWAGDASRMTQKVKDPAVKQLTFCFIMLLNISYNASQNVLTFGKGTVKTPRADSKSAAVLPFGFYWWSQRHFQRFNTRSWKIMGKVEN